MSCENCSQNTIIKELCGFRYQGLSRLECYDYESSLKIPRALVMKTESKKSSFLPSTSIVQGETRLIANKRGERILVLRVKRSCKIRSLKPFKLLILRAVLETMVKLIRLWLNCLFFFIFFRPSSVSVVLLTSGHCAQGDRRIPAQHFFKYDVKKLF